MKIREALLTVAFSTVIAVAATAASPKVRADYDHLANFGAYKTFGFVSPPGTEVDGYPAAITQRIKAAVQREMEARGYRISDNHPDLLVNFSAKFAKKSKGDELANQPVGYYGYRKGNKVPVYKTWSSYTYDQGTKDYVEGTLNVDIVDAAASQLVWEGVAIGEVKNPDKPVSKAGPAIDRAVADIFAQYSFRTGG
jgi:hypothetical protein